MGLNGKSTNSQAILPMFKSCLFHFVVMTRGCCLNHLLMPELMVKWGIIAPISHSIDIRLK